MFSQLNQDSFVDKTLDINKGFFLDIGAGTGGIRGNGIEFYSNTYYLERYRDWTGIAIDYDKEYIDFASKNRSCVCVCEDLLKRNINDILFENNCPNIVDYLSFDIDDASEAVFFQMDWEKYRFKIITLEHNLFQAITNVQQHTESHKQSVLNFHKKTREVLKIYGYKLLHADVVLDGYGPVEDWYILPEFINKNISPTVLQNCNDI